VNSLKYEYEYEYSDYGSETGNKYDSSGDERNKVRLTDGKYDCGGQVEMLVASRSIDDASSRLIPD